MRKEYTEAIGRLWRTHATRPLTASEIALFYFLLNQADCQDWQMPVNVANGLICPMLFKSATLERARKRLKEVGLIDYNASKNGKVVPSYTILRENTDSDKRNGRFVVGDKSAKLVTRIWAMFEDEAFDASSLALYFYLLNLAESKQWKEPVKCHDALITPALFKKACLISAREDLAKRGLITYELGDPTKTAPMYWICDSGDDVKPQLRSKTRTGSSPKAEVPASLTAEQSQKPSGTNVEQLQIFNHAEQG